MDDIMFLIKYIVKYKVEYELMIPINHDSFTGELIKANMKLPFKDMICI